MPSNNYRRKRLAAAQLIGRDPIYNCSHYISANGNVKRFTLAISGGKAALGYKPKAANLLCSSAVFY